MSETNTQNTYEQDIDQALAVAATATETQAPQQEAQIIAFPEQAAVQQPAAEQANPFPSDAEHVIPEAKEKFSFRNKITAIGVGVAALAASVALSTNNDKAPAEPVGPVGLSEISAPYQLGSESVNGDAIDTMSEVALQVTENIPGEQGGIDPVAEKISEMTELNGSSSDGINNIIQVPVNADVNPAEPGVQLVEATDNKTQ